MLQHLLKRFAHLTFGVSVCCIGQMLTAPLAQGQETSEAVQQRTHQRRRMELSAPKVSLGMPIPLAETRSSLAADEPVIRHLFLSPSNPNPPMSTVSRPSDRVDAPVGADARLRTGSPSMGAPRIALLSPVAEPGWLSAPNAAQDDSLLDTSNVNQQAFDAIPLDQIGPVEELALPRPREGRAAPSNLDGFKQAAEALVPDFQPPAIEVLETPDPALESLPFDLVVPRGTGGQSVGGGDTYRSPIPAPRPAPAAPSLDALPLDLIAPEASQGSILEIQPPGLSVPQQSVGGGGFRRPPDMRPNSMASTAEKTADKDRFFTFVPPNKYGVVSDYNVAAVPYADSDFAPSQLQGNFHDPYAAEMVYRGKRPVPTQRPWVELWRPFYTGGIYPPAKTWFGLTNPMSPHFLVYGDLRTGVGHHTVNGVDTAVWANRLNLDMDLRLTATERIHAFVGPFDRAGDFTRVDFTDGGTFINRTDLRFDTLFFEGDLGAILAGGNNTFSSFDLPFTFGFIPLIYQNGIWANDNVIGAAMALPSKHNRLFNWANYDATFFWASDQVTSDAFGLDNNAAEFFGTAWFIDAYEGYIEANYAFVHDDAGQHRSYNNFSVAFTRRYLMRFSNSIRYIVNFGQALPSEERTADGQLVILETSLISATPNTFVPYCNVFYGSGRPQSLARAGGTGGVLNNIGINFETDGLTGFPTLDPSGSNAFGGAVGLNILGNQFQHQLVLEAAALGATGDPRFRNARGDQYAFGVRYQKPLNNAWLFRTDHMYGWLRNSEDIRGTRFELRWKF